MENAVSILHLEDDKYDAELVESALEAGGVRCSIVRVEDHDGFVRAVDAGGIDLILADYALPSFDGMQALKIAAEKRPETPFIIISGKVGEETAIEALKAGATDYVMKNRLNRLASAALRALREARERSEHVLAQEKITRLNRVYSVLTGINHMMLRTGDRQSLFEESCRIAVEHGRLRMAWLGLVDEVSCLVRPVAQCGSVDGYLDNIAISVLNVPEGNGPVGTAIRNQRPSVVNDIRRDERMLPWRDEALKRGYLSVASYPLFLEGKAIGAFSVYAEEAGFFDDDEAGLLDELAADISYCLGFIEHEGLRRRAEDERRITVEFLSLVNRCTATGDLIRAAAGFFQEQSGCSAVGIRIQQGDDFPYYEARGFPVDFLQTENSLCAKDKSGKVVRDAGGTPVMECVCGNVIRGQFDPTRPFFTDYGSFWTNSTTELLATTTEADRQGQTRNRCNGEGYESVALIPLRVGREPFGLLQLNDRRRGLFTLETIRFWERLGGYLAAALAKFRAEDELRQSEADLKEAQRIGRFGNWKFYPGSGKVVWSDELFSIFGRDPALGPANLEESLAYYAGQRDFILENLRRVDESGKPACYDLMMTLPGGGTAYHTVTVNASRGTNGGLKYYYGTVQDITGRKRAEETLSGLCKKVEEEAEVSRALLRMVETINSTLDEKEVIRHFVEAAPKYMKFDRMSIMLYDETSKGFSAVGGFGLTPEEEALLTPMVFREGDFKAVDEILKGKMVVITDAANSSLMPRHMVEALHIGSIAGMSISSGGRVAGVLVGDYKSARKPRKKDLSLLKGLADGIGIALNNSRLYRESVQRLMDLSSKMETIDTMAHIDKEILSTIDRSRIIRTATAMLGRVIPCDRAAVLLKEGDSLRVAAEWGLGGMLDKAIGIHRQECACFEQDHGAQFVGDITGTTCGYLKELAALGVRSSLMLPLRSSGGTAGFLNVCSVHPGRLTSEHLSTAEKIAAQITVALENSRLYEDLQQLLVSTISSLASAIDAKSPWTKGHSERVTRYAVEIGRRMGMENGELERLRLAGLLHDVGKIGTYDAVLEKPGKLTEEEFSLVKKHPCKGVEILAHIKQLSDILPAIRHHHEKFDGTGYPDGLKGEAISLHARILCVADSFDSMTADRPYRPSQGMEYALSEFRRCRGSQFDPDVIDAFMLVLDDMEAKAA